jgi:hypothetical protein
LNRNLLIHLLGRPGEVEATRNNRLLVDDHDLVVSDPVSGVNVSGAQVVGEKSGPGVFCRSCVGDEIITVA